jgi:hypothetical protein
MAPVLGKLLGSLRRRPTASTGNKLDVPRRELLELVRHWSCAYAGFGQLVSMHFFGSQTQILGTGPFPVWITILTPLPMSITMFSAPLAASSSSVVSSRMSERFAVMCCSH